MEDRYINPVVAYRIGYLSANDSSDFYDTAHRLMIHKKVLCPEELSCMGSIYRYGRGNVAVNKHAAIRCYEMAADQGHTASMVIVGNCYQFGDMVVKDYAIALKYLTLASKLNNPAAKCGLAHMYEHGEGVKINLEHAYQLYIDAAKLGSTHAIVICYSHNLDYE